MRRSVAIVVLWLAIVVPALFARGYWDPDEPRYGAVAREVWRGEGAIVPHLNGEVYGEKPPLFFWLVAACQWASGGLGAAASRVPSAFASLLTALLLMGLVRRTHGKREGVFAAGIFLTSVLVMQLAGWLGMDMVVTCLVTGCLYLQERAAEAGRRRWLPQAGIYVLLAAILLAKGGPVLIAVIALAGTAWLRGGTKGLLARHLLWGIPLTVLLLAAWALPAAREAGESYLRSLTLGQMDRRIVNSDSHQNPIWYYLLRFPLFFLPWTLLIPAACRQAVVDWKRGGRDRLATGRYALWFVIPFLVFTLISGKRERYILPLFPAAAALVSVGIVRLQGDPWSRRLVHGPLLVCLAAVGLLALGAAVSPLLFDDLVVPRLDRLDPGLESEVVRTFKGSQWALVAGAVSAVLVVLDALLDRSRRSAVTAVCASLGFLVAGLSAGALPAADRVKSYEPLIRRAERVAPDGPWVLVGERPGPYCLGLDRHDFLVLRGDGSLLAAAAMLRGAPGGFSGGREGPPVIFTRKREFRRMRALLGEAFPIRIIAERQVGGRRRVVFTRGR